MPLVPLVTCPCPFRLRRLAGSVGRGLLMVLGRGIFLGGSRIEWLFWNVHVHFDCTGSHKVWVVVLWPCPILMRDLAEILVKSSLRGPCVLLHSSLKDLVRDPDEILSCPVLMPRSYEDPAEILKEVFAWSCTGPYEKTLWKSCWNPLRSPCALLHRSLWEDLVEILVKSSSLHDIAQLLMRRSCGDPGEVLPARSLHALVQLLMRRSCGDPGEKLSCMILYRPLREDLEVKSSGCPCITCAGPCEKILLRSCSNPPAEVHA